MSLPILFNRSSRRLLHRLFQPLLCGFFVLNGSVEQLFGIFLAHLLLRFGLLLLFLFLLLLLFLFLFLFLLLLLLVLVVFVQPFT